MWSLATVAQQFRVTSLALLCACFIQAVVKVTAVANSFLAPGAYITITVTNTTLLSSNGEQELELCRYNVHVRKIELCCKCMLHVCVCMCVSDFGSLSLSLLAFRAVESSATPKISSETGTLQLAVPEEVSNCMIGFDEASLEATVVDGE